MRFLIDAQLPRRLVAQLREAGFDALHTLDLPDGNRTTDEVLISRSIIEQRVVVTKDTDFVESFLLNRKPWKLFLISTGNIRNDELMRLFEVTIPQLGDAFQEFDFVELNRTTVIYHL